MKNVIALVCVCLFTVSAIGADVIQDGRNLTILGDDGANNVSVVTIDADFGVVEVTVDDVSQQYEGITFISANLGGGDDSFTCQDTLCGVHGGSGNDTLAAGTAGSFLYGDGGNDTLIGNSGFDWMFGGAGSDTFIGKGRGDWAIQ